MKKQTLIGFLFAILTTGIDSKIMPVGPWFQKAVLHSLRTRIRSSRPVTRRRDSKPNPTQITLHENNNDNHVPDLRGGNLRSRRSIIKIVASILIGIPLLAEIYGRFGTILIPRNGAVTLPDDSVDWSGVQEATIVFHGALGPDDNSESLMNVLKQKNNKKTQYVAMIDWFKYSKDTIQAGPNALLIGRDVARQLLSQTGESLQRVHIIGISVGGIASEGCSKELKKTKGEDLYVQQTMLDPFQSLVINFGWGKRNLGSSADYAQQYLNTDDPVPSTNAPLPLTVCYDVTPIRPPDIFGHDWPTIFYASQKDLVGFVPDDKKLERGVVITVSS